MSLGRAYDLLRGYINREWDRIQGMERLDALQELDEVSTPATSPASSESGTSTNPPDLKAHARQILGVSPTADFDEIRKAFERLSRRSDPANFPEGTPEANHAADILKKVNWAYRQLTDDVDAMEKRFKSLEIE